MEAEVVEAAETLLLLSSSSWPSSPALSTSATAPWLDLPNELTELILDHLPFPDYARFAFVCPKWRDIHRQHRLRRRSPPPPPPFMMLSGNRGRRGSLSAYSLTERRFYRFQLPNPRRKRFFASFFGWILFLRGPLTNDRAVRCGLFLWNPISGVELELPPKDDVGCNFIIALSAPPLDPNCVVMVITDDIFLLRPDEADWTRVQWDNPDFLVNPVSCRGKFYTADWDTWNLIIIDPAPTPPTVEYAGFGPVDKREAWTNPGGWEFLVECNGELLRLVVYSNSLFKFSGFRVFRADLCERIWVMVESLGDYMLIVDRNSSYSVLADDRIEMKGNCVYFPSDLLGTQRSTGGGWPTWKVFDFGTGVLTDGYLPKKKAAEYVRHHRSLCWFVPSFEQC